MEFRAWRAWKRQKDSGRLRPIRWRRTTGNKYSGFASSNHKTTILKWSSHSTRCSTRLCWHPARAVAYNTPGFIDRRFWQCDLETFSMTPTCPSLQWLDQCNQHFHNQIGCVCLNLTSSSTWKWLLSSNEFFITSTLWYMIWWSTYYIHDFMIWQ